MGGNYYLLQLPWELPVTKYDIGLLRPPQAKQPSCLPWYAGSQLHITHYQYSTSSSCVQKNLVQKHKQFPMPAGG